MLKMMTWASVGLSLLGALVDLVRPDASGGEAAEIAMLARMVLGDGGASPPGVPPATR